MLARDDVTEDPTKALGGRSPSDFTSVDEAGDTCPRCSGPMRWVQQSARRRDDARELSPC